jgi:hypothetical protein
LLDARREEVGDRDISAGTVWRSLSISMIGCAVGMALIVFADAVVLQSAGWVLAAVAFPIGPALIIRAGYAAQESDLSA